MDERVLDEDDFVLGEVAPDLRDEPDTIGDRVREAIDETVKKIVPRKAAPAKAPPPKAKVTPAKAAPAKAAPAKAKAAPAKRISAGEIITSAYDHTGNWLYQSRVDVPVGRLMQLEAPLAGKVLDDLLAHTFIDRAVLQPLVRQWDRIEAGLTVIVPPLLLAMMERNPAIAVAASAPFEMLIAQLLSTIVPALEEQKEKEGELEKSLVALGLTRLPHPEHPDQLLSPVQSLILTLMSPPGESEGQ